MVQATNTSSFSQSYIVLTFFFFAVLNHLSGCIQTRPGTLNSSEHSLRGTVCPKPKPFTQNFLMSLLPFMLFLRVISSSQLDVGQHFHSVIFWPLSKERWFATKRTVCGLDWPALTVQIVHFLSMSSCAACGAACQPQDEVTIRPECAALLAQLGSTPAPSGEGLPLHCRI